MPLVSRFRHAVHRLVPATLLLTAVVACGGGGPTTPGTDGRPTSPALSVQGALIPGQDITLRGGPAVAGATITIDGQPAVGTPDGTGALRVRVPTLQGCDVDGRPVTIQVAGGGASASVTARVTVDAPALAVGESRVVSTPGCVQIPRGAGRYAFSVVGIEGTATPHAGRFAVGAGTAFGASGVAMVDRLTGAGPAEGGLVLRTGAQAAMAATPALAAATDQALATARPGDVVSLPAVLGTSSGCSVAPDAVLLKRHTVLAVAGQTVVLIAEGAAGETAATSNAALTSAYQQAAAAVDRWVDPALTQVLGAAPAWYPTAGGRRFLVLDNLPNADGLPFSVHTYPTRTCAASWQLNAILANAATYTNEGALESLGRRLAATGIHELTHVADLRLNKAASGRGAGWYVEALAQDVVTTAVRLAAGSPASRERASAAAGIALPWADAWLDGHETESPFGASSTGRYQMGPRVLLMARELDGTAGASSTPTLYQRLMQATGGTSDPSIAQVASAVGTSVADLLDRTGLATATDDQIAGATAAAQFQSIANGAFVPNKTVVAPGQTADQGFTVEGGGVWARYLDTDAAQGASIRAQVEQPAGVKVRLTRLR